MNHDLFDILQQGQPQGIAPTIHHSVGGVGVIPRGCPFFPTISQKNHGSLLTLSQNLLLQSLLLNKAYRFLII